MATLVKYSPMVREFRPSLVTDVGGQTRYPVGFPLAWDPLVRDDLYSSLYRTKVFSIHAVWTGTWMVAPGQPTVPFSNTFDFTVNHGQIFGSSPPQTVWPSEKSLVAYGPGFPGVLYTGTATSGGNPFNLQFFFFFNLLNRTFSNLYYPNFAMAIQPTDGPNFGVGGFLISGGISTPLFAGSFLNRPCPYYLYAGPGANITPTSTVLTIISQEFWPYDPGDGGGPIYNSTTGAAIRNPFNP